MSEKKDQLKEILKEKRNRLKKKSDLTIMKRSQMS